MKNNFSPDFSIDRENYRINVKREFAATLDRVWMAWTQADQLDQWWAPKPYVNKTKSMDFKTGGFWLYSMTSPDGDVHWSRADYKSIATLKSFSGLDAFCDENGVVNNEFPRSLWTVTFDGKEESGTLVNVEIKYDTLEELDKTLEMGFKEGFTMGMENLDDLLAKS